MEMDLKLRSRRRLPLILIIAAFIAGIILSIPISGLGGKEHYDGVTTGEEQLAPLDTSERSFERLKDELDQERQKTGRIEQELLDEKGYSQELLLSVQRYRQLAGMTDVTGPGIILVLEEKKGDIAGGESPGAFLIHQQDLLNIINELWHNDAEAIGIGTYGKREMERITTFSPARCSGGAIEVNDRRMVPPFEIRAIGDPGLLKSALEIRGGYLEKLRYYVDATLTTSGTVFIPSYSGSTHWLYAMPVIGIDDNALLPGDTVEGEGE